MWTTDKKGKTKHSRISERGFAVYLWVCGRCCPVGCLHPQRGSVVLWAPGSDWARLRRSRCCRPHRSDSLHPLPGKVRHVFTPQNIFRVAKNGACSRTKMYAHNFSTFRDMTDLKVALPLGLTYLLLTTAVRHIWLHRLWSRGFWDLEELHSPKLQNILKGPVF